VRMSARGAEMKSMPLLVWLAPAALLVIAVARLPYGYYTFMRIVTCGAAIWIAIVGFREKGIGSFWPVLFALVAALFNPLIPIHFHRAIWFYLDLATAALFLLHLIIVRSNPGVAPTP
jgi:hypothetical protein